MAYIWFLLPLLFSKSTTDDSLRYGKNPQCKRKLLYSDLNIVIWFFELDFKILPISGVYLGSYRIFFKFNKIRKWNQLKKKKDNKKTYNNNICIHTYIYLYILRMLKLKKKITAACWVYSNIHIYIIVGFLTMNQLSMSIHPFLWHPYSYNYLVLFPFVLTTTVLTSWNHNLNIYLFWFTATHAHTHNIFENLNENSLA